MPQPVTDGHRPHLLENWELSTLTSAPLRELAEFLQSGDESITFDHSCCVSGHLDSPSGTTQRFDFIGPTRLSRIGLSAGGDAGDDAGDLPDPAIAPGRPDIISIDYCDRKRRDIHPPVYLNAEHPADYMAERLESALAQPEECYSDWLNVIFGVA